MSTQEKLLDQLDNSREALLVAIEPLTDEALLQKGAVGSWSVADVLINQTAWEAELVTAFMQIDKKKRPERLLKALKNLEKYDNQRFAETQNRDLDQVFADFQQVRMQVEDWLLHFSDKDLSQSKRFKSIKNQPLSEIVAATTFQREKTFIPQLRAFAKDWQQNEEAGGASVIPLTSVTAQQMDKNHDPSD